MINKLISLLVSVTFVVIGSKSQYVLAQEAQDIPDNSIVSIAWSPNGSELATANNNGEIKIWNAESGVLLRNLITAQPNIMLDVSWSPDGTRFAATVNEDIYVWNALTWSDPLILVGHLDPVWSLSWYSDSTRLASVGYAGSPYYNFFIWDVTSGTQTYEKETSGYMYSVAWQPNGSLLATTAGNSSQIWDESEPNAQSVISSDSGELVDVEWSPNGEQIVSVGNDTQIVVRNVDTGEIETILEEHFGRYIWDIDWSPDGNKLVSGSSDGTARIWDLNNNQQIEVIEVGTDVFSVTFNPDGTKIAYGTENGTFTIAPVPIGIVCTPTQTVAAGDVAGFINAINAANANPDANVIGIEGTYTFTAVNNGLNALPKITTDIKICAQNGATLARQAGSPAFRFFEVASNGTLTLENLTLTGAEANADPGGAILNTGNLTVNNVTFSGNHAGTGAAIDNHRFGGTSHPITATISNSTFENNTANYGAALDNDANATMTVTSSTFTGNVAVHDGGAIRNHGVLSLTDSQILNNTASAGGSGIFSTGSTTAHNSCISGNTTTVTSVVHVGSNVQDFAGNYWGAADGPSGAGGGSGDSVNHSINIADFLTACPYSS